MTALEKCIFEIIGKWYLAGLATITEDGKPWVRYVMAIGDEDLKSGLPRYGSKSELGWRLPALPRVRFASHKKDQEIK